MFTTVNTKTVDVYRDVSRGAAEVPPSPAEIYADSLYLQSAKQWKQDVRTSEDALTFFFSFGFHLILEGKLDDKRR